MAPEQARGKQVDRRADIFAFGVVLYEMLTGQRPFQGEDVSLTLAAVMTFDPDLDLLPETLSATLKTYLARCLAKDPKERVRDIGDVRLAMAGGFDAPAPLPLEGLGAWFLSFPSGSDQRRSSSSPGAGCGHGVGGAERVLTSSVDITRAAVFRFAVRACDPRGVWCRSRHHHLARRDEGRLLRDR